MPGGRWEKSAPNEARKQGEETPLEKQWAGPQSSRRQGGRHCERGRGLRRGEVLAVDIDLRAGPPMGAREPRGPRQKRAQGGTQGPQDPRCPPRWGGIPVVDWIVGGQSTRPAGWYVGRQCSRRRRGRRLDSRRPEHRGWRATGSGTTAGEPRPQGHRMVARPAGWYVGRQCSRVVVSSAGQSGGQDWFNMSLVTGG